MGDTVRTGQTSLRTAEIWPALPEDAASGNVILPAEPLPAPTGLSPIVSKVLSPAHTQLMPASSAVPEPPWQPRQDILDKLVSMLHQSQVREERINDKLVVLEGRIQNMLHGTQQVVYTPDKNLSTRVSSAEYMLLRKEKELKELRTRSTYSSVDYTALVASFSKINQSVQDLASRISDSLEWYDSHTRLGYEALRRLESRNKAAYLVVEQFLISAISAGVTLSDVAAPIAQSIFCAVLNDAVFVPFAPGCSHDHHKSISSLYAYVCSRETTEHRLRWRAQTYHSLRPPGTNDHALIDYIVKTFFCAVHDVFISIARDSFALDDHDVFLEFRAQATTIAMQALHWRDAEVMSTWADLEAFYVWPLVRRDTQHFELVTGITSPNISKLTWSPPVTESVVLTTSLGLRTSSAINRARVVSRAKGFAMDYAKLVLLQQTHDAWRFGSSNSLNARGWSRW